jgi:hypothetical protein
MIGLFGLAAAPAPDRVDAVSQALARGVAAEAAGDARTLLEAARLLESNGARPEAGEPDLASRWRAQALARGVRDSEAPLRGRALGPAYRRGRLDPGAALATDQVFLAGQKAMVALVPEPGRALSIRVAAPDQPICDLPAQPPRATCAWLPLFTSRVTIRIANRSPAPASYYLVSN